MIHSNKIFIYAYTRQANEKSFLDVCMAQGITPTLDKKTEDGGKMWEIAGTRPTCFEIIAQSRIKFLGVIFS